MNCWEIICVIVGALGLVGHSVSTSKGNFKVAVLWMIIHDFICAALILLPLYFNYWRK